jgi:hypothetical protein
VSCAAVKPRGAGRKRQPDAEQAALTDLAVRLYLQSHLSSRQISALPGVPERTILGRVCSCAPGGRMTGSEHSG